MAGSRSGHDLLRGNECFHRRSNRRDTAHYHGMELIIRYPHHPRSGNSVTVIRTHTHGGMLHLVVLQPDGTLALLPAWMTESAAASLPLVQRPALPLTALRALNILLGAIIPPESSPSGGSNVDQLSKREPAGSVCGHGPGPAGRGTGAAAGAAATRKAAAARDPQRAVGKRQRGSRR